MLLFIYHPTTVLVMLLLDWGGLLIDIPATLSPFTLILTGGVLFTITTLTSYYLQLKLTADDKATARKKAVIAGLLCAVPYPMMSSVVGAMILTLSGFDSINKQGLVGIFEMFKKRD